MLKNAHARFWHSWSVRLKRNKWSLVLSFPIDSRHKRDETKHTNEVPHRVAYCTALNAALTFDRTRQHMCCGKHLSSANTTPPHRNHREPLTIGSGINSEHKYVVVGDYDRRYRISNGGAKLSEHFFRRSVLFFFGYKVQPFHRTPPSGCPHPRRRAGLHGRFAFFALCASTDAADPAGVTCKRGERGGGSRDRDSQP